DLYQTRHLWSYVYFFFFSFTVFFLFLFFFFFQAEDGIRDRTVTGVQTCALPIWPPPPRRARPHRTRRRRPARRPSRAAVPASSGDRVIAATSCPAATSSGTSRTPITPLAPATKTRIAEGRSEERRVGKGRRYGSG